VHGVHVHFGESRRGNCDSRREKNSAGLADLAEVTSADEPDNITGELRPPETFSDECASCIESLVTEVIMSAAQC
jgi:hypothetical protein